MLLGIETSLRGSNKPSSGIGVAGAPPQDLGEGLPAGTVVKVTQASKQGREEGIWRRWCSIEPAMSPAADPSSPLLDGTGRR